MGTDRKFEVPVLTEGFHGLFYVEIIGKGFNVTQIETRRMLT
jgi:hypothetical protein